CVLSAPHFVSVSSLFQCVRHHRDLHSFPTRRSSDLKLDKVVFFVYRMPRKPSLCPLRLRRFKLDFLRLIVTDDSSILKIWDGARSEEHTSELQSRENLVCRLLLEKKKR